MCGTSIVWTWGAVRKGILQAIKEGAFWLIDTVNIFADVLNHFAQRSFHVLRMSFRIAGFQCLSPLDNGPAAQTAHKKFHSEG